MQTQMVHEPDWRRRKRLQRWASSALLFAVAVIFLIPLVWMLSSSLKPEYQVFEMPPRLIPDPVRWENYREALTYVPFGRYTLNTAFITILVIIGHTLSCTHRGIWICPPARARDAMRSSFWYWLPSCCPIR